MKKISAEPIILSNEKRIKLNYEYDKELNEKIRAIPGRSWNAFRRFWHVPYTRKTIEKLNLIGFDFEPSPLDYLVVGEEIKNTLLSYHQFLVSKRLGESTINGYFNEVKKFLIYNKEKSVDEITIDDINTYIYELVEEGVSSSRQNIIVSSLKQFFQKIKSLELDIEKIERPKKSNTLPKVISKEHIQDMLSGISNIKHQTALSLIYALGLRRSELINLRLRDIDSKSKVINIRNAKGKKDRTLPIKDKVLSLIKRYYKAYRPKEFLFEGIEPGTKYSAASLQKIFHKHMDRVIPNNHFSLHSLRHSYATHLLDDGTDVFYVQNLLGHKNISTTEIYLHLSMRSLKNVKSPFEDLDI